MSSMPQQSPYSSSTVRMEPSALTKQLLGLDANSPAYSPYKAMSRQASNVAKMVEGMTSAPSWSSMYAAYGVPEGTDLTPYIKATRTGGIAPTAPIPASPAAGSIPEYVRPSDETKKAAEGGLMSLRGYKKAGAVKSLSGKQAATVKKYNNMVAAGKDIPASMVTKLNNIETRTGKNVSPYTDTGIAPVKNKMLQSSIAKAAGSGNYPKDMVGSSPYDANSFSSRAIEAYKGAVDVTAEPVVPLHQALDVQQPGMNLDQFATDTQYGGLTSPIAQQAMDQLRAASQMPEYIGQGAGMMGQASQGLQGILNRSWTDPGMAQAYMNPYIETALKSQEDLANRQFAQQQNLLRSRAAQAGAFGGSASALAEQAAQQNQNLTLKDLVAQGMNQAYQQGMGQFATEQGQGLQGYNQMGQLGQGLGGLGVSTWGTQLQGLLPAWNTAATNVQTLGEKAGQAAQQTGQNYWGAIPNAYQPVTNLVTSAAGQVQTGNTSKIPGQP